MDWRLKVQVGMFAMGGFWAFVLIESVAIWSMIGTGPCDIYAAADTPCVAAHSTVRALFGSYAGPLYEVTDAAGRTLDIPVLARGGFASSATQDEFCEGTTCVISRIYDQTNHGNHLAPAPAGGNGQADAGVNASRHLLTVGGHRVYGASFEGGQGYRNDSTQGIATGDDPESMYAVFSGKHYNNLCCFDYGNAEIDNNDDGAGTMEAIYWGSNTNWGRGDAGGPWVMADLENGLWAGDVTPAKKNTPIKADYVTAMVKGDSGNRFAIKAGDAAVGPLVTMHEGARPQGWNPMRKQGAIILGIGGDNSNAAVGTFYEGVMTAGYTSKETDLAVQGNIVAAGYGM